MKKVLLIVALLGIFVSCNKNNVAKDKTETNTTTMTTNEKSNSIDVVCFYGKNRCITCRHIEQYSKELINSIYKTQENNGEINFKTVDFSTKEGEKIADKYQITFSSLLLIKHINGKESVTDMTDFAFSTAKEQEKEFKDGLKTKIDSLLNNK